MVYKVFDFTNDEYFVEYPYQQAKKSFEHFMGLDQPIDETHRTAVPDRENPFSIYYDVS